MTTTAPQVGLRSVAEHDEPFLRRLYASVREDELARLPWDEADKEAFLRQQFDAQDEHYRAHYDGASFHVLEVDGERVGRLYIARWEDEIRIMDIALVPAFRGRGIGTRLLRTLIDEAEESARKLSIHVETNNFARRLYERLGFKAAAEHGVYVRMERLPT
jgi:ribosomal protein S18 acetylase RimI-like enzyme